MIRANLISKTETGNRVIIEYEIREGYEQEVPNEIQFPGQPSTRTEFVTNSVLKQASCVFNYFPVTNDDIEQFFSTLLK